MPDKTNKMTKEQLLIANENLRNENAALREVNGKLNKLVNALTKVVIFFFGDDRFDKLL